MLAPRVPWRRNGALILWRCHLQVRDVTVHRLVARSTVDEGILQIADRKLRIEELIMAGEEEEG